MIGGVTNKLASQAQIINLREAEAMAKASAPSMSSHVHIAMTSLKAPVRIPRTLEEVRQRLGGARYEDSVKLVKIAENVHAGQRKLCLALIEFLTEVHNRQLVTEGGISPVLVLYVGASVVACLSAHDLFPNDRFVCYDPNPAMTLDVALRELGPDGSKVIEARVTIETRKLSTRDAEKALRRKPILLFTGQSAGTFNDSACRYIVDLARISSPRTLVFASDIRRSIHGQAKEHAIAEDMVNQARWAMLMNVGCYCFKFRLPFTLTEEIRSEYAKLGSPAASLGKHDGNTVRYLGGSLTLQKYARDFATEVRLMSLQAPEFVEYDIKDVESLFAAFNVVHRGHTRFKPSGAMTSTGDIRVPAAEVMRAVEGIQVSSDCHGTFDPLGEACVIRDAVVVANTLAGVNDFRRACARFCSMFLSRAHRRHHSAPGRDNASYSKWVKLKGSVHTVDQIGSQGLANFEGSRNPENEGGARTPERSTGSITSTARSGVIGACFAIAVGAATIGTS
jgi:hypothetical protein